MTSIRMVQCCFRYHKGTDFQANHNPSVDAVVIDDVVLDTTKVQIFKQITTAVLWQLRAVLLFQIPQRYRFSSKSQLFRFGIEKLSCCFRYHKGTDFQANHNTWIELLLRSPVVLDTTKVQIFKQITTLIDLIYSYGQLFQIPQRYRFSSKSQHFVKNFILKSVVLDTTKVQIFKQITTTMVIYDIHNKLFQIPQRYRFSSKSQLF